jgi:hypothetical protein
MNDAQRTALADRRAGGPVLGERFQSKVPQARRGVFRGGAAQCAKWLTHPASEETHANVIGRCVERAEAEGIKSFPFCHYCGESPLIADI